MRQQSEPQERREDEGGAAKEQEAALLVKQKDDDGPGEIELLFDGQGPEVRERQSGRTHIVADLWCDQIRVLEIESERQEFAVEVKAKDQGGDGEGCDDSVIEGEDAEDSAGVELAEEGGVGEPIGGDSGEEEA